VVKLVNGMRGARTMNAPHPRDRAIIYIMCVSARGRAWNRLICGRARQEDDMCGGQGCAKGLSAGWTDRLNALTHGTLLWVDQSQGSVAGIRARGRTPRSITREIGNHGNAQRAVYNGVLEL
jgi:hypothetical protein